MKVPLYEMRKGGVHMDINLEKIELVKDRTGSTYAEAKEALEKADGSVVDAIIDIEEKLNKEYDAVDGESLKDSPIFAKMKEIVDKGNVSKIIVRKGEKVIVNFPLTAGVIGAVLIPWGAILGIIAALGAQCDIEFVDDKGEIIDLNGKVVGVYEQAKVTAKKGVDKAQEVFGQATKEGGSLDDTLDKVEEFAYRTSDKIQEWGDKGSAKFEEAWDKLEENGTIDDVKAAFEKGTSKLIAFWDKLDKNGKLDEVMEAVDKISKRATETAKNIAKDVADKADKADKDFIADAEDAVTEEFQDEEI
jgi:hypothetical protein